MTGEETVAAHVRVTGRVQGVWYRQSAAEQAQALGLSGWVRNETDGSVEALAQGDREAVDRFVSWCRHGPSGAIVSDVEAEWLQESDAVVGFNVRY